MKQILFKIGKFPLVSETFIVSQIITAIDLGYEVVLLVKDLSDFRMSKQEEIIKEYGLDKKILIEDYKIPHSKPKRLVKAIYLFLTHLRYIGKFKKYYESKPKFSLTYLFQLVFYLKFRHIDVIHIQYGTNAKPVDDLKKAGVLRMSLVVTFHGHDAFFPINGFIPQKGYYDTLFDVVDIVTVNTPYLERQLRKIKCPEKKIKVIPVPVNPLFTAPENHKKIELDGKIKLLSVGRLEDIKGHHLGIEAVARLVHKNYNIFYRILGEGRSRKKLQSLVSSFSLEHRIELIGAKSLKEVRAEYLDADIFLMTSVAADNGVRETQGLVSLEAQSSGLPVVAFDSGGVRYTIDQNRSGFICEERNISQFVEAIERLIEDPPLYKSMSVRGPKFVEENFSFPIILEKWKDLYQKIEGND